MQENIHNDKGFDFMMGSQHPEPRIENTRKLSND
jgi:hypothetical protein